MFCDIFIKLLSILGWFSDPCVINAHVRKAMHGNVSNKHLVSDRGNRYSDISKRPLFFKTLNYLRLTASFNCKSFIIEQQECYYLQQKAIIVLNENAVCVCVSVSVKGISLLAIWEMFSIMQIDVSGKCQVS